MSRLQTYWITFALHLSPRIAKTVGASHRQSEVYGFDSRQGRFSEIRLDTHNHNYNK